MRPEQIKPRWDTAQSMLHEDDRENMEVKNAYGSLRYIKEDTEQKNPKEGFILEALEAPGTPGHMYCEKHLDLTAMEKIRIKTNAKEEQHLYASGVPFQNQAVFYDVKEKKEGRKFLDCLKQMIEGGRHRTLQDAFGFLCRDSERLLKKNLEKERLRTLTLEEFDVINKQIDLLNDRLQKKEAKERQLCGRLQLMLDRREEKETQKEDLMNRERNSSLKRAVPAGEAGGDEAKEGEEEENNEEKNKKMT